MNQIAWKDAWTGGQYSVVRSAVGLLLTGVLLKAAVTPGEFVALNGGFSLFSLSLAIAAFALTLGIGGKGLALFLIALLPFGIGWEMSWHAIWVLRFWFLFHLVLASAPYGSWPAHGRENPDGGWQMPGWVPACWQTIFVLTRFGAGVAAAMQGHQWLAAAFLVPGALALARPTAGLAWSLSFGVELGLWFAGSGDFTSAWLLHLVTFQPAWIPPRTATAPATLFYDGTCALCHGAVRFLMAEDREPAKYRIAPLEGEAFLALVPESVRVRRPDSILVVKDPAVLMRTTAVAAILTDLGGIWGLLGAILGLLPRGFADTLYDAVASRRYRWFGHRKEVCPLMSREQRARFDV